MWVFEALHNLQLTFMYGSHCLHLWVLIRCIYIIMSCKYGNKLTLFPYLINVCSTVVIQMDFEDFASQNVSSASCRLLTGFILYWWRMNISNMLVPTCRMVGSNGWLIAPCCTVLRVSKWSNLVSSRSSTWSEDNQKPKKKKNPHTKQGYSRRRRGK